MAILSHDPSSSNMHFYFYAKVGFALHLSSIFAVISGRMKREKKKGDNALTRMSLKTIELP
jgi:hypothetical protein